MVFGVIGFVSVSPAIAPSIAIVDDDADVRGSLDSLLRSAMMTPLCFASAEELLQSGIEAELACIVTDLHMPGMTGLELQAEIGRRGWHVPLILVTAHPTDVVREQAEKGGAVAFLTKPVDPEGLLEAIERSID